MTNIDWRATALVRTQNVRRRLLRQGLLLAGVVALMWLIELFDWLVLRGALDGSGIRPRTLGGLQAVVVAPFLHAGFGHLLANTIPLILLGWLVMLRRTTDFFIVFLGVALISGLAVWLLGGSNTVHLGASGAVFGLLGYLLARGYYERSIRAIGLALLAFILFGGMLWGVLPLQQGVSWQGHLFGFVGGVAIAYWQVRAARRAAGPLDVLSPPSAGREQP
jgi:membrane associated rhomboid family serine protease